jgi:hypothetical protein
LLQGTKGGSKVKKRALWIGLAVAAILGTGIPCYADNIGRSGAIRSTNRVKYSGEGGTVEIYIDDIQLLTDKVSAIPSKVFDPENYTYVSSCAEDCDLSEDAAEDIVQQ